MFKKFVQKNDPKKMHPKKQGEKIGIWDVRKKTPGVKNSGITKKWKMQSVLTKISRFVFSNFFRKS